MPMRATSGRSSAFTLIEMLSVVMILCVLAALLIPSLTSVRLKMTYNQSMNNLRQLQKGFEMYAMDNNGFYPPAYNATSNTGIWVLATFPYVYPSRVIYASSVDRTIAHSVYISPRGAVDCRARGIANPTPGQCTYGMNRVLPSRGSNTFDQTAEKTLLPLANRNETMLLIDNANVVAGANGRESLIAQVAGRYDGSHVTAVFCDGSARIVALTDIPASQNTTFWKGQ